jgi:hypothetical protein
MGADMSVTELRGYADGRVVAFSARRFRPAVWVAEMPDLQAAVEQALRAELPPQLTDARIQEIRDKVLRVIDRVIGGRL